jgi:hypothetical protein
MCQRDRTWASLASTLSLLSAIDLSNDSVLRERLAESYVHTPIDSHGGYLLKAWHEVRDQRDTECMAAFLRTIDRLSVTR